MNDPGKSSRVVRASDAKMLKDEKSQRSEVGKSKSSSNVVRSKNCLAWYVALNSKPPKEKISSIPEVNWSCPPKFNLNLHWRFAAGEGSQEREAQKLREATAHEAHSHSSAIPSGPSSPPSTGGEYCDDSLVPIIPIIPIEEAGAEMPSDTSATLNTGNSQSLSSLNCPSVFGNLPLSQCNTVGPQCQPANDKSLPEKLQGLEGSDLEVAVAAAATVAAIMESKEQIDTELLVKFLANPEMVKTLIDDSKLSSKPGHGIPPAPEPDSVDKLINKCSEPVSRSIPSNTRPQAVHQSLPLPRAEVKMAAESASISSGIRAVNVPTGTSRPPGYSHLHQTAGVKPVRPFVLSTLRPGEETVKDLNQYGTPNIISGPKRQEPFNSPTPKMSKEEIKQMINKYGASDSAQARPVASPHATTSIPANMEGMKHSRTEIQVLDHQWGSNLSLRALTPLNTPTLMPHMESRPAMHDVRFISPGISFCAPLSPMVALNYNKHETAEQKPLILGQPGKYLQGLEQAHETKPIEMNLKYNKPCKYFNSSKGCRNGSKCLYQHGGESEERWRAGGVATKRMRFNEQL